MKLGSNILAAAGSLLGIGATRKFNARELPHQQPPPTPPVGPDKPKPVQKERRNPAIKLLSGITGGGSTFKDSTRRHLPLVPEEHEYLPTQFMSNHDRSLHGRKPAAA